MSLHGQLWVVAITSLAVLLSSLLTNCNPTRYMNDTRSSADYDGCMLNRILGTAVNTIEKYKYKDPLYCPDPAWCNIPLPKRSHFASFASAPDDESRWQLAKRAASTGEQRLLRQVLLQFPHYLDFIDGDVLFRKYHSIVDFFIDHKRDLRPLLTTTESNQQQLPTLPAYYKWEKEGKQVVPPPYDFHAANRAPIIKIGYYAFNHKGSSQYFQGPYIETDEAIIGRKQLYKHWLAVKDKLKVPFILLHSSNENWGLLSTHFPNRTADWGSCCDDADDHVLRDILDHPLTLMLLTNQHSNFTHHKILPLPRGTPVDSSTAVFEHGKRILWDAMRKMQNTRKKSLLFLAASDWKHRPRINDCIRRKFSAAEVSGKMRNYGAGNWKQRQREVQYYEQLASSRFCAALPGLGYDTYRIWESLLLGTMPIVEKSVGLDKMLWKLPALLVEDFDAVTPSLLRAAYVEALYRAEGGEFEFQRLSQSFWWSLIMNVSSAQSSLPLLDKFPAHAEDEGFTRPLQPFDCWQRSSGSGIGSCGPGTKRIPVSSC